MTTISEISFPFATAHFAGFAPVFLQDQETPKTEPKDDKKGKDAKDGGKGKKDAKKTRELSDFEQEAIKRIAKTSPKLAEKLRKKLPEKLTKDAQEKYIRKKIRELNEDSDQLEKLKKQPFADPKGIDKKLKENKKLIRELSRIGVVITFDVFPKWYQEILKKRAEEQKKKEKKDKAPTSKPATKPGNRPVPKRPDNRDGFNGTFPGAVLINFA